MAKRTLTALALIVIVVPAILFGGILFFVLIGFFVVLASWEFVQMFREAEYEPSVYLSVGGTLAIAAARAFWLPRRKLSLPFLSFWRWWSISSLTSAAASRPRLIFWSRWDALFIWAGSVRI
jgi:CDP-diglyceride synthetase